MDKTSIILGALVAIAFAHVAVGFGAQDCSSEAVHLYVSAATVGVTDNTGTVYTVTSSDVSEAVGEYAGEAVDEFLDSIPPVQDGPGTNDVFIGVTLVTDSNLAGDCNGDGQPGDYDGDLDVGIGGFFFGSGTTWEALCAYGHNVHATTGVTADLAGLPFTVNVGIDDPSGPTPPVFDPVTNQEIQGCQTDGTIAANPGGGPSADGDCLDTYAGNGAYGPVCGGGVGGDDGYWGFVQCHATIPSAVAGCSLAGTVTASF